MRRGTKWKRLADGEGAALIEFAVSCLILIPILFGFIEICLAFYTYNFVADAARDASRYAMVRGLHSCSNLALTDCPITAAELLTHVQGLGYPGLKASNLVVTMKLLKPSTSTPTTWTACTVAPCDVAGNQVQVTVRYNFPLGIPFWTVTTVSIGSISSMVIS